MSRIDVRNIDRVDMQKAHGPFDQRWYAYVDEQTFGPYSGHDVRAMVAKSEIISSDLVCLYGGSSWIQAKDDPVLRLLFVEESDAERPAKNLAKRGRRINAFAGSIVLLILGWFAWPYYSIYSLASAIRDGDSIALESDINWETVRQGLRADFNAMYLKSMTDQPNEMARGLGVLLGPTLINQVVEGYVTPQAIGNLIRTGKPTNLPANGSVSREGTESATPITANENRDKLDLSRIEYAFFSGNPFTFRVDVRPDKEAQLLGNTTLLFKWLGDWKLTKIILPIDEIGKLVAKPANDNLTQKVDQAAKPTAPPVRGPVVREVPQ